MPSSSRFVFISYGSADAVPFARQLSKDLADAGHQPWRDAEQLATRSGEAWERELREQLLSADLVIVVLTPGSAKSSYVNAEITLARDARIPAVPAMFLECDVPLALVELQRLDFRQDPEAALKTLLTQLERPERRRRRSGAQPGDPGPPRRQPRARGAPRRETPQRSIAGLRRSGSGLRPSRPTSARRTFASTADSRRRSNAPSPNRRARSDPASGATDAGRRRRWETPSTIASINRR